MSMQPWYLRFQHGSIPGGLYIGCGYIGQKQAVIADMGAHAAAIWMPLVEYIPFLKLMSSTEKQV